MGTRTPLDSPRGRSAPLGRVTALRNRGALGQSQRKNAASCSLRPETGFTGPIQSLKGDTVFLVQDQFRTRFFFSRIRKARAKQWSRYFSSTRAHALQSAFFVVAITKGDFFVGGIFWAHWPRAGLRLPESRRRKQMAPGDRRRKSCKKWVVWAVVLVIAFGLFATLPIASCLSRCWGRGTSLRSLAPM